ncbi:MAG: hypothetical protein HON47_03630 [Candidatus Diapherotrites archaeon]|jgi:hypothetical protein|uniref:Uncharacterized protein n=1 Tax=Candidatus Iainarchaeum sp. TaxID=3101447 RepID=A0A8T5GFZ6_9ARCH|nr:hypothetical protein [Candidatus Diapherotrites archaeon]MBT7241631.1 hypothetical protein [Candidatus Diapherotrites archaeon]
MGIILDNLSELVGESLLGWIHDKTMWTYALISAIILLIAGYVTVGALLQIIPSQIDKIPQTIISTILFIGLIVFIEVLILLVIDYLVIKRALELKGQKAIGLNIIRYLSLIVLHIATAIVAVLSLFKLKILVVGITGIIVLMLGFIMFPLSIGNPSMFWVIILGVIFIIAGIILLAIYLVHVILNAIRLSLAYVAYVEEERSIMASLKKSWDITKNDIDGIVFVWILIAVIVAVISTAVSIPAVVYVGAASETAMEMNLSMISMDPLYWILLIPSYIVSAYSVIVSGFMMTAMYTLLSKGKVIQTTPTLKPKEETFSQNQR